MAVRRVGRPTSERTALAEVMEECLFGLGDHETYCARIRRRIALLRRFADDMEAEMQAEMESISTRRRYVGHVFMELHGYPHIAPELLEPGNEETAADTAASDDYPQEEEVA